MHDGFRINDRTPFWIGLVISLVYGIIFFFLGELIVERLIDSIWPPLAVAIYMVSFALPLTLVMILIAVGSGNPIDDGPRYFLRAFIILLALFSTTVLFEFLYEMNGADADGSASSYVFAVDDTISMRKNDPNSNRGRVISEIMEDRGIPYAVYKFTAMPELIRGMGRHQSYESLSFASDGDATNVLQSLHYILSDIKEGRLGVGKSPSVILLSDGDTYWEGIDDLADEYVKLGIRINAVGFGEVDKEGMTRLAEKTGGIFLFAEDAEYLEHYVCQAVSFSEQRTLLTERADEKYDFLHMFLRILFLTLLGLVIAAEKWNGSFGCVDDGLVFLLSGIQGLLAALVMEFSIGYIGKWARLIAVLLWALMTLGKVDYKPIRPDNSNTNTYGGWKSGSSQTTYHFGKGGNNW